MCSSLNLVNSIASSAAVHVRRTRRGAFGAVAMHCVFLNGLSTICPPLFSLTGLVSQKYRKEAVGKYPIMHFKTRKEANTAPVSSEVSGLLYCW
jgi:hypothetical protein